MGLFARRRRVPALEEHRNRMRQVLQRIAVSRLQLSEAASLEELDIARSSLQAALAELQIIIRTAKTDAGLELRPVQEVEEEYRRLLNRLRAPALQRREPLSQARPEWP